MTEQRYRFWGRMAPAPRRPILDTLASTPPVQLDTATMRIYEPIDSWGGEWGISALEFIDALDSLPANVRNIDLRINSPGGEAFEAIAILNALRDHPAKVTATVDGIAASAASFLATGADETVMAPNSQMMIHDASGIAIGRAADMAAMADVLNKISDNIASIYATKSGTSDVPGWRAAMLAESWYSAQEAVDAGLADRLSESGTQPTDAFDLSIYTYSGRAAAPGPVPPVPSLNREPIRETAENATTAFAAFASRVEEAVAFRASQGKTPLSELSVEQLSRVKAETERLLALQGDAQASASEQGTCPEWAAFMARRQPDLTLRSAS